MAADERKLINSISHEEGDESDARPAKRKVTKPPKVTEAVTITRGKGRPRKSVFSNSSSGEKQLSNDTQPQL